jgi:hypothetical protein
MKINKYKIKNYINKIYKIYKIYNNNYNKMKQKNNK